MKLKQYMQENAVTGFEVVENEIAFSVILESGARQALKVDTSSVPNGTQLTAVEDFTVDGDTLTVAGITLNTDEVEITTPEERLEQLK
jgi:Tfp pilus assembly protein PilN